MAEKHVTRILCAAEPRGSAEAIRRLFEATADIDVHAVALVGELGAGDERAASYHAVFRALGDAGHRAFWVPGPEDAPVESYLREAQNLEIVFPFLHGVHGTLAFASGQVVFSGLGGEISDDPGAPRDEHDRLRYPRWEPEYRLKLLLEFPEREYVLLFATPPEHKGLGVHGSDAVAELVNTHRPRLVVCGGERGNVTIGRSLVVAPGSLADGFYAVADLHAKTVELEELGAPA
jgi:Icc-related predicted phosphoesterase